MNDTLPADTSADVLLNYTKFQSHRKNGRCNLGIRYLRDGTRVEEIPVGDWYTPDMKVYEHNRCNTATPVMEFASSFIAGIVAGPKVLKANVYTQTKYADRFDDNIMATVAVKLSEKRIDIAKCAVPLLTGAKYHRVTQQDIDEEIVRQTRLGKSKDLPKLGSRITRGGGGVEGYCWCHIDADSGESYDSVAARLTTWNLMGVIHTTYSHSEKQDRFRALIIYDSPRSVAEHKDDAMFFAAQFSGDDCTSHNAQAFFAYSCPDTKKHLARAQSLGSSPLTRERMAEIKAECGWVGEKPKSHKSKGTKNPGRPRKDKSDEGKKTNRVIADAIYDDTVVEWANGTKSPISAVTRGVQNGTWKLRCPDFDHDDVTAQLWVNDGSISMSCFGRCNNTRTVIPITISGSDGGIKVANTALINIYDPPLATLIPPSEIPPEKSTIVQPTNSLILWHSSDLIPNKKGEPQYIPDLPLNPECRITFIKTTKGSGKTETMINRVRASLEAAQRNVAIAPRRALVHGLVTRADGIYGHYEDIEGKLEGDVALCLDSTQRLACAGRSGDNGPIGLMVLDEIDLLRRSFDSGTMDNRTSILVFHAFRMACRQSKHILAASADLGLNDVRWLMEMSGVAFPHEIEVRELVPEKSPYTYVIDKCEGRWISKVIAAYQSGKRGVIACQSKTMAKAMTSVLESVDATRKIMCITADDLLRDRQSHEKVELSTINQWVGGYDWLIYSPCIQSGYSIDIESHFDVCFGAYAPRVGMASDLIQMLHRVRDLGSKTIEIFAVGDKLFKVTPQQVYAEQQALAANQQLSAKAMLTSPFNSLGEPYDEAQCRWWAVQESEKRNGGFYGGMVVAIKEYCHVNKVVCKTVADPDKEEEEAFKEFLKIRKEASAMVRADRIDNIADAEKVEEPIFEPRDRQATYEKERQRIETFYGIPIETALIPELAGMTGAMRNFALVSLLHDGAEDAVAVNFLGRVEKLGEYSLSQAQFTYRALKMFGCDVFALPASGIIETHTWDKATETLLKLRVLLKHRKIYGVPKDIMSRPGWFLKKLLASIGIEMTIDPSERKQVEGVRVRTYTHHINTAMIDNAILYSAAEKERVLTRAKELRMKDSAMQVVVSLPSNKDLFDAMEQGML